MANRSGAALATLRRHAVPAALVATGVACSVAASLYVRRAVALQEDARFVQVATATTDAIRDRLHAYTAILRATRGLFVALDREPDHAEFHAFVEGLEIGRFYRGAQGVGWTRAMRREEVPAHERAVRETTGERGYRVWPEGDRELQSSIVMLEPLDWRNQRAIGFDMYSEPTRREAMARARDTGEVAASGKVELVQEAGEERQAGFLMYLPVYRREPTTPEERRELLLGWVYAPFRAADLLRGTVGVGDRRNLGLAVYDAPEAAPGALLYDDGVTAHGAQRTQEQQIQIAGRTWTIRYAASAGFVSLTDRLLPAAVLLGGLALTLLMTWITRSEVMGRARAEQASRRTAFLAEAGKLLASDLDYRRTLGAVVELAAGRVADLCFACVVEPDGPMWWAGHVEPGGAARLRRALEEAGLDPEARVGSAAVLLTRAPQVLDLSTDRLGLVARTPALASELRRAAARFAVTAPILSRDQALGAVTFLSSGARLAAEEVALAEDLARLAGAAIDTARLTWRAQEAVRVRDEFLSIASHELKTPLTSLSLQADSLRAGALRSEEPGLLRKVEVIRRSVDRLARLVGSLLDITRITSGRLELEPEDVDLAEVARDVVARFEEEARRAGCALRLEAPGPVVGRWDRLRLDQVITNLLANAVKYGPGRPVEVRVSAAPDRAVLSVRDQGIGISDADQRRIFERFERAVSRRNYGGFGLGLWIVREIVDAQGGEVRVESTPGQGSTFTVELARGAALATPRAAERPGSTA